MNVFELSPREFRAFLEEERQYRTPEQIDDLMRRYNQANSLSGRLSGLLAPQEGRRRTTFFPASVPEGMSLFDAVRSGEAEFAVPQGLVDMVVGGVQGVENPGLAVQGRIPAADMETAALQTAGTAMAGGGVASKPAGALGANTLRVYHGGDYRYGDDINAPFFVTPDRKGAEYFAPDDVPFSSVSNFEADLSNALDIDTPAGQARLSEILTKHGVEHDYNPDGVYEKIDIYDVPDDVSYDGTNLLDAAYIPEVQDALKKEGVSALYSSADALENSSIPAYAVVDPTILGANASKSAGLLSVASDVSARGDQILNMLKSGRGSEVTDAMLDMGDSVKNTQLNQYLAANYDLPMDEASRLQRQREMFPELGYHGTVTSNDFTSFRGDRETYIAPRSDEGLELVAQFSSADQGRVLPVVSTGNILDTASSEGMFQPRRDMQRIYDEQGLGEFRPGDKGLPSWADTTAINAAKDAGYGGIRLDERDWVNSTAVYEPKNIRSQFARFDPRLAHLSNLTAANASPISGLLAQSGVSSEQAQRIEDYLYRTGLLQ